MSNEADRFSKTPRRAWWHACSVRQIEKSRAVSMTGERTSVGDLKFAVCPLSRSEGSETGVGFLNAKRSTALIKAYAASKISWTAGDDRDARVLGSEGRARPTT